jgi:N-acetylglucosamine-6-sulfatase
MSSKLSCGSSRSRRSLAALVLVLVGCDQAPRARGVGGAVVAAPERSPTAAPALAPSAARPNILVIMSDDQRADTVRCMPRMARSLGAQGTTFTHHFASTPLCCPARSTFLTGLYPRHHGVLHNGDVEDPGDQDVDEGVAGAMLFRDRRNEERSIAVALRAAGYRTGYFGKYLNAYDRMIEREGPRVPLGWDEWRAFSHAEYYNFSLVERGIGAAAPQLKFYGTNVTQRSAQSRLRCRQTTRAGGTCVSGSGENYSTDVLAEQLDRFIQRAASDQAAWFAVLAVKSPHGPFESPARYQPNVNVASFSAAANAELASCPEFDPQWTNAAINEADITDKPAWIQRQPRRDPAALADLRRQQLVSMLAVEDAIERIDATLARTGMRDKTVVLFVGDNGFSWGEHRYVAKNCAYESCVRVPLVVRDGRHPTLRPRALDTMTVDVDLAPTIVELAGASLPTARDGQSLVPIITGRAESTQRSEVFLSCWGRGPNRRGQPDTIAAVRTNRWKLIEHFTDATAGTLSEFELYDLQRDPLELDNLLAPRTSALSLLRFDADARQALAVLRPRLDAWRTDGAAPAASGQDAGVASDAALPSLRDWPESPPSGPSVQSMRVQGTTRIEQLIGDRDVQRVNGAQAPVAAQTDSRFGVFGTDLGYSFEHEGRLWFLFGDTRLRSHDVGAPDVLAFTDAREPPIANRLEFLRESQSSRAVFEYRPPGVAAGGSEVPSSGLSLNGRMYVLFKTDKSEDGSTDRSVLTRFDPATRAITVVREFSRLSAGGRFIKAAFALSPGGAALPFDEPVVLAWGTGHYRHSQVYLQVIRARAFEQPTAADVRFFAGRQPSGAPIWSQREPDAVPVITYGQAGDVSVTRVASLGVWLALYDRRDGAGVGLAWSATAWGPFNDGGTALDPSEWRGRLLHAPNQASSNVVAGPLMNRAEERDGGTSSVGGGAYGPYVIERFTRVSEEPGRATLRLRWLLSTWNPYVVHLMESAVDVRR